MMKKRLTILCLLLMCFLLPGVSEETFVFPAGVRDIPATNTDALHVYVANLVGADCIILVHHGQAMLVDSGMADHAPFIARLLEHLGIAHIDMAFSTHPHVDHMGGFVPLLEHVTIGTLYTLFDDDVTGNAVIQRQSLRALRAAGVQISRVANGDTLSLGDAHLLVLHKPDARNMNEQSAMLHLRFGERTLLLSADVDGVAQRRFGEQYNLKSDVLKYPHHGLSRLNRAFLASVSPGFSVIPHGSIGSQPAQEQLSAAGIPFRFASWGPIRLSTDGSIWAYEQYVSDTHRAIAARYGYEVSESLFTPDIP